jgi:hypothetical protein
MFDEKIICKIKISDTLSIAENQMEMKKILPLQ